MSTDSAGGYADALGDYVDKLGRSVQVTPPPWSAEGLPEQIGSYRLRGRLAPPGTRLPAERLEVLLVSRPGRRSRSVPFVMKALVPGSDAQTRQQFTREIDNLSRVHGARAVRLVDTGESDDGIRYLVLDHVEGETLAARLRRGPLDPETARRVAMDLLVALSALHAVGMAHLDVKPANIMVTTGDRVTLLDFGAALHPGKNGRARAERWGTLRYADRARLRGEAGGPGGDLFSWAVTMVEAITGRHPFNPRASRTGETDVAAWLAALETAPDLGGIEPTLLPSLRRALTPEPPPGLTAAMLAAQIAHKAGQDLPEALTVALPSPAETVQLSPASDRPAPYVFAANTVYPRGFLGLRRRLRDRVMPFCYHWLGDASPRNWIVAMLAAAPVGALSGVILRVLWSVI